MLREHPRSRAKSRVGGSRAPAPIKWSCIDVRRARVICAYLGPAPSSVSSTFAGRIGSIERGTGGPLRTTVDALAYLKAWLLYDSIRHLLLRRPVLAGAVYGRWADWPHWRERRRIFRPPREHRYR